MGAIGIGDNLMASGIARGAAARGTRIAFGNAKRILWDQYSELIFRGNPNVARPGEEGRGGLEWIPFYKGHRIYNTQGLGKWIWNYEFRPIPGEVFLSSQEQQFAVGFGTGFVVIEPNVPIKKSVAPNKQWPVERYDQVAGRLRAAGYGVVQFIYSRGHAVPGARYVTPPDFRYALAMLERSALYIGAEGGLHHGAAAMKKPAVVLFGGFIPPAVTGYDTHTNLTGGATACGSWTACAHCRAAMEAITVDEVVAAARAYLP